MYSKSSMVAANKQTTSIVEMTIMLICLLKSLSVHCTFIKRTLGYNMLYNNAPQTNSIKYPSMYFILKFYVFLIDVEDEQS